MTIDGASGRPISSERVHQARQIIPGPDDVAARDEAREIPSLKLTLFRWLFANLRSVASTHRHGLFRAKVGKSRMAAVTNQISM